ncbi:hypothetical protein FOS14_08195 [Skermania sp. ID1734]|uniref:hypothetical protein n=1 Tax=Skermania sp. ID1734 TaxID=2597516 RepID=UPI00117D4513|nr:hypothetical protein [Skermania sp. ID1734]TSE00391.1 hypothetical protein FOS14_08195 [Skermania sp. ID1734]
MLAETLAARGFAALRFDYYGTGDSALDSVREDIAERWLDSVNEALAYLQDLSPHRPAVIALRAGALIAGQIAIPLGPVILWDPISNGRAFVREQRALYSMTVNAHHNDSANGARTTDTAIEEVVEDPDTVALIGTSYADTAAKKLAELRLSPTDAPIATRWLVAPRRGRRDPHLAHFCEATAAEHLEVDGMVEFVQPCGYVVRIPGEAIQTLASWLDRVTPTDTMPIDPRYVEQAVFEEGRGITVIERIEFLGPNRLFAIRSQPADDTIDRTTRTALFFGTANDTHHGPNREWVTLSRLAAAAGACAVRFDRRGVGETAKVKLDESTAIYSAEAIEDAFDAAAAAAPPSNLLAAGVCSGSWFSAQLGRTAKASAVVLINVILWSWRNKHDCADNDQMLPADFGLLRTDPAFQRSFRGRFKSFLSKYMPYRSWLWLGRFGVTQVPEVLLRPLLQKGIRVSVILAPFDADWFRTQRGPESLQRLDAPLRVIRTDAGDHTAYHPAVRAAVRSEVLSWCKQESAEVSTSARQSMPEAHL